MIWIHSISLKWLTKKDKKLNAFLMKTYKPGDWGKSGVSTLLAESGRHQNNRISAAVWVKVKK